MAEKAFLATLYLSRDSLLSKRSFKDVEIIFESIDLELWKEAYHDIEIDTAIKEGLIK